MSTKKDLPSNVYIYIYIYQVKEKTKQNNEKQTNLI